MPTFHPQGGIELTINDVDVPPATSVWAKLNKVFDQGGEISIRGDVDTSVPDIVDLDVRANGFETSVQLLGQVGTLAPLSSSMALLLMRLLLLLFRVLLLMLPKQDWQKQLGFTAGEG